MRFESIRLPEQLTRSKGLAPVDLTRLTDVVCLIGRNGAGKSRILGAIYEALTADKAYGTQRQLWDSVRSLEGDARAARRAASKGKKNATRDLERAERLLREKVAQAKEEALSIEPPITTAPVIQRIGPQSLGADGPGFVDVLRGVVAHYWNATDPRQKGVSPDEVARRTRQFNEMHRLMADLLGRTAEIDMDAPMQFRFGDYRAASADLSFGEQAVLARVADLIERANQLKNCLLLWDEPEEHLHPEAATAVFQCLRSVAAQVIVATHSLSIMSVLEPHQIWLVEDGKLQTPGSVTYQKGLQALAGPPTARAPLELALDWPLQQAALRFAADCLAAPLPAGPRSDDPQQAQAAGLLENDIEASSGRIRVLDYGAGEGRLAIAIQDAKLESRVEYVAYEPKAEQHPRIRANATQSLGLEAPVRILSDLKNEPEHSYDRVVLCNVLHEIDPEAWPPTFSQISRLLKHDGKLLIMEVNRLPKGELAHRFGFLVLGQEPLRQLFASSAITTQQWQDDHRLESTIVPAAQCNAVTPATVALALSVLQAEAEQLVERSYDLASRDPRRYAFAVHHLVNAQRARKWATTNGG